MEYKPKLKRANRIPFGYYHPFGETRVLLPDPKALDNLHYAFQMRAKYKTGLNDCVIWLHRVTGYKISPQGFRHIYEKWLKNLKKQRYAEIMSKARKVAKEKEKAMHDIYGKFGVTTDEGQDITALAYQQALKTWKTKKTG